MNINYIMEDIKTHLHFLHIEEVCCYAETQSLDILDITTYFNMSMQLKERELILIKEALLEKHDETWLIKNIQTSFEEFIQPYFTNPKYEYEIKKLSQLCISRHLLLLQQDVNAYNYLDNTSLGDYSGDNYINVLSMKDFIEKAQVILSVYCNVTNHSKNCITHFDAGVKEAKGKLLSVLKNYNSKGNFKTAVRKECGAIIKSSHINEIDNNNFSIFYVLGYNKMCKHVIDKIGSYNDRGTKRRLDVF